MTTQNPYLAPRSAVAESHEEYQPVRVLATAGRIGRARYIAYATGLPMLIMMAVGALGAFLGDLGVIVMMLGWLAGLIPLVNLIFWCIPGTDGPNRFGAKTAPNSVAVLIIVWIFPALFITGILAAVSIPAYNDYVKRSQQR